MTFLAVVVSIYLCLADKEPSLFLQTPIYVATFVFYAFYLYNVQKQNNDKVISKEKVSEELTLIREDHKKNDNLQAALQEKIHRFLDLQRFSRELKEIRGVQEVTRKIVDEAHAIFKQADECVLYLVDDVRQELGLVAATQKSGVVREKEGSLYEEWVMKRARAILIEDARNDFRFPADARPGAAPLGALCASPLMTENRVLGVLRISSQKENVFDADDLRLLDIFSNLAAVILKNDLLYDRMQELALRDSLTGLYLNRYFQERLNEEIARARFNNSPFSIILLDIDLFKRYNDEFGHAVGDLILKGIASIILKCVSPVDFVARYGGEEFVILLPKKEQKEAKQIAEKIRSEIEKHPFYIRRAEKRVTASLGVASFPEDGKAREELIRTADRFLYDAKNLGRNRVCGSI